MPLGRPFQGVCSLGGRLEHSWWVRGKLIRSYVFSKLTHCYKFTRIFEEQLVAASMKGFNPQGDDNGMAHAHHGGLKSTVVFLK